MNNFYYKYDVVKRIYKDIPNFFKVEQQKKGLTTDRFSEVKHFTRFSVAFALKWLRINFQPNLLTPMGHEK